MDGPRHPSAESGLLRNPHLTGVIAAFAISAPAFALWHWSMARDQQAVASQPGLSQSVELIAKIDDGVVCRIYKVHTADGRDLLVTTGTGCRAVDAHRSSPDASQ